MELLSVTKERVLHWDIAKAVGMFLVVFGHLMFSYDSRGVNTPINQWIYSFHMALFFIISGYFFSSSLNRDFKIVLISKFTQLIVPVVSWSIVTFIINDLTKLPFNLWGKSILSFICEAGFIKGLWFLKALFVYYITGYISVKIFKNELLAGLICIITISSMPRFGFIYLFPVFFWIGHFLRRYNGWLNNKYVLPFSILMALISFLLWKPDFSYISQTMDPLSICMRIFSGVSWTLVVIILCKFVTVWAKDSKIVNAFALLGASSMGIYAIHQAFFMNSYCEQFYRLIQNDNDYILFACSFVVYIASYGFTKLFIRQNILCKLLIGK